MFWLLTAAVFAGSAVPGGLIVPFVVCGGSLGRLSALCFEWMLEHRRPSAYPEWLNSAWDPLMGYMESWHYQNPSGHRVRHRNEAWRKPLHRSLPLSPLPCPSSLPLIAEKQRHLPFLEEQIHQVDGSTVWPLTTMLFISWQGFEVFPTVPDPGTYAIVGAASFMAATGRLSMFFTVLMLEATGYISYSLPISIGALLLFLLCSPAPALTLTPISDSDCAARCLCFG